MNSSKIIFKNERTLASAGSGKTYTLTNRYIALVAAGARPEEICALTFTRKAAAEFFDKTMEKLARAAVDENFARELSGQLNAIHPLGKLQARDFLGILERFAKSSHKLRLETIDSFASKYARAFAYELGVFEGVEILDEFSAANLKRISIFEALERLRETPEFFSDFAQTFKEANYGRDSKSISSKLESFADAAEGMFFDFPDKKYWGSGQIFGGSSDFSFDEKAYESALNSLGELFGQIPDEKEREAKLSILKFFKNSSPEAAANLTKTPELLARFYAQNKTSLGFRFAHPRARKSSAEYEIGPAESELVDRLAKQLLLAHKKSAQNASKAIFKILNFYELVYDLRARSRGKMTFSDILYTICRNRDSFARELVEYRLDSKINHWLFDEFQDTSRMQWQIFEDLISEAVLNSDGEKSFYYVGDKKQSIYSWRGGDSSLFDEIYEKFKGRISDNPQIKTSWRSCPAVINFVNRVFSDSAALELHYGNIPAERWLKDWQPHDVAPKNASQKGQVSCVSCGQERVNGAVYEYLKELNPLARGLSAAILVQRNSTAQELIDYLRARAKADDFNLRVAGELEVKIASDNQAIPALLAFAKSCAHPCDSFAKAYAEFSPLREYLKTRDAPREFLRDLADFGFKKAFLGPAEFLASEASDKSGFTALRLGQFLEAAAIFDASYARNIDLFSEFIENYKVREGAPSDTVQVMSIHKSKGLDFDVVILPELSNPRGGHAKQLVELKDVGVLALPPKEICLFDEKLSEVRELLERESACESLCKFYVALTRAKRAIHLILPEAKKKGGGEGKRNFALMLCDILGAGSDDKPTFTADSDPSWISEFPEIKTEACALLKAPRKILEGGEKPSEDQEEPSCPENPAKIQSQKIIGLAAHSILENLNSKTLDLQVAERTAERLYKNFAPEFERAKSLVKKALANPEISKILSCENSWVEFPFSLFKDGKCASGRFDRVNFGEGKAEIIDFKSDLASSDLQALHSEQLEGYAEALMKLTNLKRSDISLKIVSLSEAKILELRA